MICRLCHFYSMPVGDVYALPIRLFWLLSDNIDRIRAQSDLRSLTNGVVSTVAGNAAKEHRESLILEVGTIVKHGGVAKEVPKLDRAGLEGLRALSKSL
ncbi:hypothetical protein ACODYM_29285 [Burkholderia gladioli]|uniref:hypothetical protein n=1 Tax=Burkholderia gladioli TaxID=28095 RepID=UPI003B514D10